MSDTQDTRETPRPRPSSAAPCSACGCDTPQTHEVLNLIFDRDGELCERNAPERWVKLARKLERRCTVLEGALRRMWLAAGRRMMADEATPDELLEFLYSWRDAGNLIDPPNAKDQTQPKED